MEVKLFTLEGLKVTLIHDLLIVGMFAAWMFTQVTILGNDVTIGGTRASQTIKK
jgi:hypothetical protein